MRLLDNHADGGVPSCPQAYVLGKRARADMTDVDKRENLIFRALKVDRDEE